MRADAKLRLHGLELDFLFCHPAVKITQDPTGLFNKHVISVHILVTSPGSQLGSGSNQTNFKKILQTQISYCSLHQKNV